MKYAGFVSKVWQSLFFFGRYLIFVRQMSDVHSPLEQAIESIACLILSGFHWFGGRAPVDHDNGSISLRLFIVTTTESALMPIRTEWVSWEWVTYF